MFGLAALDNQIGPRQSVLPLLIEVKELLQQNLYTSAALLGQFLVSQAKGQPLASTEDARLEQIEATVLLGDSFHGLKEYQRAIGKYEGALQLNQLYRTIPSNDNRSLIADSIRMKIALSLINLGADHDKGAIDVLEAISQKSLQCHQLLASLYQKAGRTKAAILEYRKVLEGNPMAISAAIALIKLGVDSSTVSAPYKKSTHQWISNLLDAHGKSALHEHRSALATFSMLSLRFPNNYNLLIHKASTQLHLSDADDARTTFSLAHQCDPYALEFMDMYAWVLRMRSQASELGSITQTLLNLDQSRPEPWVAVALYCDQRGDRERAIKFLDKAISLAPRHIAAYLVKGFISLAMGSAEAAVQAYKQAHQIDWRELDAYTGLVESYLALPQFNDALFIAKAAIQALPRNARALTLFGTVLSRTPEGREKAGKAFMKALSIDPKCIDAVLALVKLCIAQKQFPEAIALLEQHLAHHPTDVMHTKLAGVYAQSGNIDRALIHYHTALSLTPESRSALSGIERLEASLKDHMQSFNTEESFGESDFEPVYQ